MEDCCNVIQEKPDNQTDVKFNVQKPEGVESQIYSPSFPEDTNLLFPLVIDSGGLNCEDMNINPLLFPTQIGNMTCNNSEFTIPDKDQEQIYNRFVE